MFMFFLGVSLLSGVLSYMNMDPMKSSFFLILSMLMCMPMLSFSGYVWFSYFICLLFLSGIFVILVYFSSLSKINLVKSYLVLLSLLLSLFVIKISYNNMLYNVSLNVFYYSIFWVMIVFILLILLFFMNFTSYFLNFSGALRKV
uniref:NADH dehydrogenase subunit 6 n=1 Tax=Cyathostomum pateratum TaxID=53994 RepID=A0A343XY38_9BILA|nr:NADH dehydrogenase subunit 6 [Cyathostomum pateratum]YP_010892325.1 NADH dehydrogenase subunit 6 [Cylicostephanus longibursatus]AWK48975.1 NADH dehydrogenase subunit 6 [Cyathostomum pateratum]WJO90058.1 NADH dehydrogenase subunit 6 [Cylicostephanus longibursatus]